MWSTAQMFVLTQLQTIEIHSKHGIILNASSSEVTEFAQLLIGRRYGTLDGILPTSLHGPNKDIYKWIMRAM